MWFRSDLWSDEIWHAVRQAILGARPQKHPLTVEICVGASQRTFLKIFFAETVVGALKDCFRRSKAVRALFISEILSEKSFNAPVAVAAGEERYARILRRSFVVTLPVEGSSLPDFLRHRLDPGGPALSLRFKREIVGELALEIRRFHDQGFVHGDLVPSNIFATLDSQNAARFCFMDNDRTRHYPLWWRHRLWRRNLVQLNRFPLAGISLQDRMRFFHVYVRSRKLGSRERKVLRWLEHKTRQRRRECDAVDASGSFRKLMRWQAPGQ
ncbi:MAG TPA: lipopolysaccharide kinase InaA family protein [Candidatus Binatia bacterium]|nr:lipopolysaccharide kinase InaA family protein [Candidatus Binatia bacterium]